MNRRRLAFLAVVAVFVILFGGRWVALRYTEHLWFESLGEGARWRWLLARGLLWQGAVFLAALVWYGAHSLGVYGSIGSVHLPRRLGNLEIDEAVPPRTLRAIALGIAVILALATAYSFSDIDHLVALARQAVPVGINEPVLGRDAAFYMAVLPLLEALHLLLAVCTVLAAVLVISLYAVTGSLTVSRRRIRITPHARTHLIVLLCGLAIVVAWGFHIDALQLVGGSGHAAGALTPADKAIRIPASNALAVIGLAVAAGSVLALRWVGPRLLFGLWVVLAVSALLGRFLVPVMTEAWGASGDPALQQQINQLTDGFSRAGFGLVDLPVRPLPAGDIKPESTAVLGEAVDDIYAWSGEPVMAERLLRQALPDNASPRHWSITAVAAADSAGRPVPAALAVPQTDLDAALHEVPRPRWTPLHRGTLAWGGEPVALNATLRSGDVRFLGSLARTDSAPSGTPLVRVPGRLRFLPYQSELAVVGPDENSVTEPAPGVLLSGTVRRMLLAWALQSPPLLDDHTSQADRVLYWRDLPHRLERLYPFATFEAGRAALVDGRLTWIVDGSIVSGRFPLAEAIRWRGSDVNYVAPAYVATVDGVSGRTRLYLRPSATAFAASVARAEAVSPLPADSMPPGVRENLRYPASVLGAQVAAIAQREGRDSRGPSWQPAWPDTTAESHDAALLQPTSAFLSLEWNVRRPWELLPVNDVRGDHLAALVAGTVQESGHLSLVLLQMSSGTVPSVSGAAARIGAAPALAVAAAGIETAPHRGPVLVIPAAGTIVFAQALMSGAPHGAGPTRMEGVAVLAGNRVGFGSDGRSAARSLARGDAQGLMSALFSAEMAEARAAALAMDSARQAGDWERYGRAWANLRRALRLETAPPGARP